MTSTECPPDGTASDAGAQADAEADPGGPARDACDAFAIAQVAFVKTCKAYDVPRESLAETCRGLTNSPGSIITDAEIRACADDIRFGARTCSVPLCVSSGQWTIFPGKGSLWWSPWPYVPREGTRGTLADGSPCLADLQCASAECRLRAGAPSSPACGVCRTTKFLDQSCTGPTDTCIDGTTCAGGACILAGAKIGETCSDTVTCQSTLYCKRGLGGSVCVPKRTIGETCSSDDPCVDLVTYCHPTEGRCREYRTSGAACTSDDACEHGLNCIDQVCVPSSSGYLDGNCDAGCTDGLVCIDDVCRRLPGTGLGEGAPCLNATCAAGLTCAAPCNTEECSYQTSICRRFSPGEPCGFHGECSDGLACELDAVGGLTGTCQPLRDVGEACGGGTNRTCHSHLTCIDERCETFAGTMCR